MRWSGLFIPDLLIDLVNGEYLPGIFNEEQQNVIFNGSQLDLLAVYHHLVIVLVDAHSLDEIFERVWNEKVYEANNTVMVHIRRLRGKMKEDTRQVIMDLCPARFLLPLSAHGQQHSKDFQTVAE